MTVPSTTPITAWAMDPAPDRGIRFWRDGGWQSWSYGDLASLARRTAAGLEGRGVVPGDRVLVVQPGGPEFVASMFGAMLVGAVPCPVAPPAVFPDMERYGGHLRRILEVAEPSVIVTTPHLVTPLVGARRSESSAAGPLVVSDDDLAASDDAASTAPWDVALMQFTSGSSGAVKGVVVPVDALTANIASIRSWTAMTPDDATASWLPVHHDMGLIGCLLAAVVGQRQLWLMEPADFLRQPMRYLRCFNDGAAMSAMPPFGLDYITSRVRPEDLDGCDFSSCRALVLAAERIDLASAERFLELVGPAGFDRRALLPAYGLAEATLAVTGKPMSEQIAAVPVTTTSLSIGQSVRPTGADRQLVVGCGRPLEGTVVSVVDDEGREVADGLLGQIVVGGSSVARGYATEPGSETLTEWRDGRLWTGDAGFVLDGQLFVLGRLGDAMKVRGRTLFAEDVEIALGRAGLPLRRLTVLLGSTAAGPTAVVLLEDPAPEWVDTAEAAVRRVTELPNPGQRVLLAVPRGTIRRTTSGKPKRRELWSAHIGQRLGGRPAHGNADATAAQTAATPSADVRD